MFQVRKARPEDAGAIANVHVKSWITTYSNLIDDEDLRQVISYEKRKAQWEAILKSSNISQFLYVAENDKQEVVGFINGGNERSKKFAYDGEIYAIYILKEYQGKGIGRQLLKTLTRAMKKEGYQSILVWVLTSNPSSKFYEYHGAKPVDEEEITIGTGTYQETAYGWEDIGILAEKLNER
ncbi:MAG: GNAT family N-acetyltransferase [Bacillaceae bacterium]|nr:GNAT family N-acetyltransferase [Bacillaceae bacterium]